MSCKVSCNYGMTSPLNARSAASGGENVMGWRLPSYYYIHMNQRENQDRFFDRLKYQRSQE